MEQDMVTVSNIESASSFSNSSAVASTKSPQTLDHVNHEALSIATSVLNNVLSINENLLDDSFLSTSEPVREHETLGVSVATVAKIEDKKPRSVPNSDSNDASAPASAVKDGIQLGDDAHKTDIENLKEIKADLDQTIKGNLSSTLETLDEGSKSSKKKSKAIKRSAKLDAKSKLEKSRQSARECRARKKLRYQYLEDLVCNREKAVVKLREELSMFCKLSRQLEVGDISDREKLLLVDLPIKE